MLALKNIWLSGLALGAIAGTAYAQPDPPPDPDAVPMDPGDPMQDPTMGDPAPVTTTTQAPDTVIIAPVIAEESTMESTMETERSGNLFDRFGFAIALGGGVSGFTDDTARETTNDGGSWGVRATFGTRSVLAFEAAYIGSAQSIDALGLDDDALLVGNGVQGALRLNVLPQGAVQPFIYGGAAWRRYDLTRVDFNTSDIAGDDDVFEIPVGVGGAFRFAGFMADARVEYRRAFREDLMPSLSGETLDDRASLHRYGVTLNVGYEF